MLVSCHDALKVATYLLNVQSQSSRDGLGVFDVLFRYHGQVGDLKSIIGDEIVQGVSIVSCNFIRWQRRHDYEYEESRAK